MQIFTLLNTSRKIVNHVKLVSQNPMAQAGLNLLAKMLNHGPDEDEKRRIIKTYYFFLIAQGSWIYFYLSWCWPWIQRVPNSSFVINFSFVKFFKVTVESFIAKVAESIRR